MTKKDYLTVRITNPTILIYEKYREKHDPNKHGRLLGAQELLTFVQMWRNPHDILQGIIEEYDTKFDVVHLLDRNGQLIKLL